MKQHKEPSAGTACPSSPPHTLQAVRGRRHISLVLCTVLLFTLGGCGGAAGDSSEGSSSLAVCLASEPETLDPALNSTVDGATLTAHLFSGLARWSQDENGAPVIVPDAAQSLPEGVKNEDGTVTYTYTLRSDMTWSDGHPVTARDFAYAWQRAASPQLAASYSYMFQVVEGYDALWETDSTGGFVNPTARLSIEAVDQLTLSVTLATDVPYWNELLAFPAYFPVREDVASDEGWASDPSTYVSNGPFTMDSWAHDSLITLKKNPAYYQADAIKMDTLHFYLSDDANNMLTNFENGAWQFIDILPTNEIFSLQTRYPDEYHAAGQLGTYYVCWNINENLLPQGSGLAGPEAEAAQAEIRRAVSLLFDRSYIARELGQAGQLPASSFVPLGMTKPDGSQFSEAAGGNPFPGYFDVSAEAYEENYSSALDTLQQYYDYDETTGRFTDFPTLTYLYNTDESHKAIGEYLQAALAAAGISMSLENQEWSTFLNTRKNGDFSMARNGWLADYNDPICFLDMWVSDSGNNDVQFGKGAHASLSLYDLDLTPYGLNTAVEGGTWAETYDVLIAAIKTCSDDAVRYPLMHLAEDILMSTGCIMPLYFYTDSYLLDSRVQGFYSNPLGFKYFMYCTIK